MKFSFTMNMQSRSGNPTHQVTGEVDGVDSIEDMLEEMLKSDFILIEEFYRDTEGKPFNKGKIILNTIHIGKVKVAD